MTFLKVALANSAHQDQSALTSINQTATTNVDIQNLAVQCFLFFQNCYGPGEFTELCLIIFVTSYTKTDAVYVAYSASMVHFCFWRNDWLFRLKST